jgi:thiol-disulfide isomerase/thioredoxin
MAWSRRRSIAVGAVAGLVIGTLAAVAIARIGDRDPAPDAVLTNPGAAADPDVTTSAGIPVAKEVRGTPLPDGQFDLLAGGTARFSNYRGTPLVVNVWASWCPPCQQEMPDFEKVHQSLGDRVRIVGLDRADSRSTAEHFATERGITYDLLFDPDDTFAPTVGVAVMPTTLLVSPDGVVVKTIAGSVDAGELTAAINEAFPP